MKPIALASDHAGFELKAIVEGYLEARGVAYKDYIHSRTVYNLCHSVIIRSKHRYFFASLLHFD